MKKLLLLAILLVCFSSLSTHKVEATRGCCSWHGGVSYCDSSAGRYVCNDGTYSPSCGCAYSPQVYTPPVYIPPTPTPTPITLKVNTTYELSPATCTYTIIAAWGKPSSYDQYSVSAVQTASRQCQDPGPIKQGKFKVYPKGAVIYTLTAQSTDGEVAEEPLIVTDATPTPTILPTLASNPMRPKTAPSGIWTAIRQFFSHLF